MVVQLSAVCNRTSVLDPTCLLISIFDFHLIQGHLLLLSAGSIPPTVKTFSIVARSKDSILPKTSPTVIVRGMRFEAFSPSSSASVTTTTNLNAHQGAMVANPFAFSGVDLYQVEFDTCAFLNVMFSISNITVMKFFIIESSSFYKSLMHFHQVNFSVVCCAFTGRLVLTGSEFCQSQLLLSQVTMETQGHYFSRRYASVGMVVMRFTSTDDDASGNNASAITAKSSFCPSSSSSFGSLRVENSSFVWTKNSAVDYVFIVNNIHSVEMYNTMAHSVEEVTFQSHWLSDFINISGFVVIENVTHHGNFNLVLSPAKNQTNRFTYKKEYELSFLVGTLQLQHHQEAVLLMNGFTPATSGFPPFLWLNWKFYNGSREFSVIVTTTKTVPSMINFTDRWSSPLSMSTFRLENLTMLNRVGFPFGSRFEDLIITSCHIKRDIAFEQMTVTKQIAITYTVIGPRVTMLLHSVFIPFGIAQNHIRVNFFGSSFLSAVLRVVNCTFIGRGNLKGRVSSYHVPTKIIDFASAVSDVYTKHEYVNSSFSYPMVREPTDYILHYSGTTPGRQLLIEGCFFGSIDATYNAAGSAIDVTFDANEIRPPIDNHTVGTNESMTAFGEKSELGSRQFEVVFRRSVFNATISIFLQDTSKVLTSAPKISEADAVYPLFICSSETIFAHKVTIANARIHFTSTNTFAGTIGSLIIENTTFIQGSPSLLFGGFESVVSSTPALYAMAQRFAPTWLSLSIEQHRCSINFLSSSPVGLFFYNLSLTSLIVTSPDGSFSKAYQSIVLNNVFVYQVVSLIDCHFQQAAVITISNVTFVNVKTPQRFWFYRGTLSQGTTMTFSNVIGWTEGGITNRIYPVASAIVSIAPATTTDTTAKIIFDTTFFVAENPRSRKSEHCFVVQNFNGSVLISNSTWIAKKSVVIGAAAAMSALKFFVVSNTNFIGQVFLSSRSVAFVNSSAVDSPHGINVVAPVGNFSVAVCSESFLTPQLDVVTQLQCTDVNVQLLQKCLFNGDNNVALPDSALQGKHCDNIFLGNNNGTNAVGVPESVTGSPSCKLSYFPVPREEKIEENDIGSTSTPSIPQYAFEPTQSSALPMTSLEPKKVSSTPVAITVSSTPMVEERRTHSLKQYISSTRTFSVSLETAVTSGVAVSETQRGNRTVSRTVPSGHIPTTATSNSSGVKKNNSPLEEHGGKLAQSVTVQATSSVAVSVGAALRSATAAANIARFRAYQNAMQCRSVLEHNQGADDGEEESVIQAPSFSEHPIQPSVGNGQPAEAKSVGASVASSILILSFTVALLAAYWFGALPKAVTSGTETTSADGNEESQSSPAATLSPIHSSSKDNSWRHFLSIAAAIVLAFFIPNTTGSSASVIFHAQESSSKVICALCLALVTVVCVGVLAYIPMIAFPKYVAVLPCGSGDRSNSSDNKHSKLKFIDNVVGRNGLLPAGAAEDGGSEVDDSSKVPRRPFVQSFVAFFDAASEPQTKALTRLYFFEDVMTASILALLGSIKPTVGVACVGNAVGILILSIFHLLFLAIVQPYRERIDSFFAMVWAVNSLALGICAVAAAKNASEVFAAAEVLFYVQTVSFFVQPALHVGILLVRYCANRRRQGTGSCDMGGSSILELPLVADDDKSETANKAHSAIVDKKEAMNPLLRVPAIESESRFQPNSS